MATLVAYSESFDPKTNRWVADQAHTYELVREHTIGLTPVMLPMFEGDDVMLKRLLRREYSKLQFAFSSNGLPGNMSHEVKSLAADSLKGEGFSHLTREDLQSKATELLIIPDQYALIARPHLLEFIQHFPNRTGDPAHQRIIYWFY